MHETRKFKPVPIVYRSLAETDGKGPDEMGEIWLVTSNPFDVVGARAAGMKAAWVDREGVDGCLDPWGRRKAECGCQWIRGRH